MGYDCTLHVVDPSSIARFVDWFFARAAAPAFESAFDTRGLREEITAKIEQDPHAGARAVLHGLLMFCSAEAPHLQSRNFCVGLWNKLGLGIADELPADLITPNALRAPLAPFVERFPALASELYTGIDGNYAVGHYVPPDKVPALREHVERTLDEVSEEWRPALETLRTVLRVAEARGLAYWEASDLQVANGNASWLRAKRVAKGTAKQRMRRPDGVTTFAIPETGTLMLEDSGRALVSSIVDQNVWVADARGETSTLRAIPGLMYLDAAARAPDGRLLATATALYEIDLDAATATPLPLPAGWEKPSGIVRVRDELLLFPSAADAYNHKATPVWLASGRAIELPLDAPPSFGKYWANAFGDGSTLLLVANRAYRVTGTHAELLPVPPITFYGNTPGGATRDDGSVVLALGEVFARDSRRESESLRLFAITVAGQRIDLLPQLARAYPAWPGPDDALIIKQQEPLERDLLKIYWHRSGAVTSIPLAWASAGCRDALYAAASDELWVHSGNEVVRFPWAVIAELPRQTGDEFVAAHRALIAANQARAHARTWAAINKMPDPVRFDDPKRLIIDGIVIEHPQYGRGLVRTYDLRSTEYEAEFEDGSVRSFPRPR